MIRTRSRIPLAAVLVAVLSACTTQVAGSPVPVPNPTPVKPVPTAANLLGDLPSFDPCSLVEPADLAPHGTPAPAKPDSLDHCPFTVTTASNAKLDVTVGLLDRLDSEGEIQAQYKPYRDLRIAVEREDPTRCARRVVFTDLVTLTVAVDNFGADKTSARELCGIADHVVRLVADRVLDKEVGHRTFPARSLGRVDPCSSVSSATAAKVPGMTSPKVKPYPAAHQCRWSKDGSAQPPRLRVTYAVGVPTVPDGRTKTAEDVGGRPTTISKSSSSSLALCAAETAHIPVDGGEGLHELAFVTVNLPTGSQVEDACAAAKAIAAEVWSHLPK
ncbi:DUF3558 domain-containing protein [Saccharothrix australiensis]|uniref:Uncharacterized protein DUF3558 n=1 Tax=Saccharothrix australiensis TaxID=2072 RepID=A0A495W0C1_9PSEU|nr:DUF3558 domain-containing protein [Saccharothrix australiensis]RKT54824.1 uncharacterized protein DUF3558 [Saccharothrix australiensis]